jgi:hypothetical protein
MLTVCSANYVIQSRPGLDEGVGTYGKPLTSLSDVKVFDYE